MLQVRSLGVGEAFLCTGCVEDLFRKEIVDRMTFYRRGGTPPEHLESIEATLRQGSLRQTGLPQEIWGEILADRLDAALPEEARWEAVILQAIQDGTIPPDFQIPPELAPPAVDVTPSDFLTPPPAPTDLPASPTIPGTGSRA